jgi:hypothetical protein
MTTEAGSSELGEGAGVLVECVRELRGALQPVDAFHMQHDDFARRAEDFAGYLSTALDLLDRHRFVQSYALIRSGFDHWGGRPDHVPG